MVIIVKTLNQSFDDCIYEKMLEVKGNEPWKRLLIKKILSDSKYDQLTKQYLRGNK